MVFDEHSGKEQEHTREEVEEQIAELAKSSGIEFYLQGLYEYYNIDYKSYLGVMHLVQSVDLDQAFDIAYYADKVLELMKARKRIKRNSKKRSFKP